MLTLMQTGKANIVPVVLLEGPGGEYWEYWEIYVKKNLLANGWINPEDLNFYHYASSVEDAIEHIINFYKRYHSYRYVRDLLVIRLNTPLSNEQVATLNEKFSRMVKLGKMYQSQALPEEKDHLELSRLVFHHTRKDFGLLRQLIDEINGS